MIRSGVTILYAHWEGFIKAASLAYVCYVAEFSRRNGLLYKDLSVPFRSIVAKAKLDLAVQSPRTETYIELVNFLLNQQEEKCHIPIRGTSTSNLNSRILRDIIVSLGLDYGPYVTKEKLIDSSLLDKRNNIAHGKGVCPSNVDFEQMYHEIIKLLDLFRNQIENAGASQLFKVSRAA
jgi:hypothetical protein